ncbi:hypothetical protein MNB_ARC-1_804 [hydrothermal vent metagenome]|uniref:Outer membrane lipoprotein carrier protein LolA n=1 Tax=hydrothermal vent metagenome TaxID=652676 RepID=A0A3B1DUK7_9ZZZZ
MKFIVLVLCVSSFVFGMSLSDMDSHRANIDEGLMSIKIVSIKKNKKTKKTYDVFRKNSNTSLVVFTHENEKGTVVLKENNNLYIKTQYARNPIRITPMQRLFGDASIGDVLELTFSKNYKIQSSNNGVYVLKAINNKSSYNKIIVYVKNNKLIKSELFSFSGKKLKTLFYKYNKKTKLIDSYTIKTPRSQTLVEIVSYKNMKLSRRIFKLQNIKNAYYATKKYRK